MHELETLLGRLKLEHLGYQAESLLEQAAKEALNYREFFCAARCNTNGAGGINAAWSRG